MTDWLGRWSYPGIFVCVFIGNFGIPVPEEVVLLAAGFLAGRHVLELGTLYIIAILSAVAGDTCGFVVGRTGGQWLFGWLSQKSRMAKIFVTSFHCASKTPTSLKRIDFSHFQPAHAGSESISPRCPPVL